MGTLLGVVGIGADAGLGVSAMEDSRRNGGIEGIREHYVDSAGIMRLSLITVVWYLLTVYYNAAHKLVVHDVGLPLTIAAAELLGGIPLLVPAWLFNRRNGGKLDFETLWNKFGNIGFAHAVSTLLSAFSMHLDSRFMTVHNVARALEPLVCLSLMLQYDGKDWKEIPRVTLAALALIVMGTITASPVTLSQASWAAFVLHTVGVTFGQMVTTLSKKHIPVNGTTLRKRAAAVTAAGDSGAEYRGADGKDQKTVKKNDNKSKAASHAERNNVNEGAVEELSGSDVIKVVTVFAALVATSVAVVCESSKWGQVWHNLQNQVHGPNVDPQVLLTTVWLAGMAHYLMNECAFRMLSDVSPLSLTVGSAARRALIVLASVIFRTSPYFFAQRTLLGFSVALVGVSGYFMSTRNHFVG